MRFWKRAALRVPVTPVLRPDDTHCFAAEARVDSARTKLAFDIATARMARDAATPALGKGTPPASRARY